MASLKNIKQCIARIRQKVFLDPTIDPVIKMLFSKDCTLIHFLNAILHLPAENQIVSIRRERKVTVILKNDVGREEVRFDIHARLGDGSYVDLEMQRASGSDFLDRIELYASQLAVNSKINFDKGRTMEEREAHPYLMPPTYSIWLCNFNVPFCKSYREEISLYRRSDLGNAGALPVYRKKNYIIVDLTKFQASVNPQENEWLNLFAHAAEAQQEPVTKDKIIADAYSRLRVEKASHNLVKEVAGYMFSDMDYRSMIACTREEYESRIADKDAMIATMEAENADKDAMIATMEAENADKEAVIANRDAVIAEQEALIKILEEALAAANGET